MAKVAIYIRLSKEDMKKIAKGEDSESIKNQKLLLSEYAAKRKWQIYDFYIDEDYSGADRDRPDFDRLLRDAKNRKFEIVLCKTQNRFLRDLEAVEEIIHGKFLEWGIRFVSLLDGADTAIEGNKKSRQIHGMIDEWYLEDLSKNIREVFKAKMEDGQYLGSFPPYGYIKDPDNKHKLIIDEEAAKVVRKIYSLYLKGYGTHKIAQILTKEGIEKPFIHLKKLYDNFSLPNVSEYGLWSHTTINRILRNPVYIGTLIQGKETTLSYKNRRRVPVEEVNWIIVEDNHESIISKKDFYEVQKLLDSKRRNIMNKGNTHIFATKVKCLHCGGPMIRSTTKSKKQDGLVYAYLKCKNHSLGGDLVCKYSNRISYGDLYDCVEAEFVRIIGIYKSNSAAKEATTKQIKTVDSIEEIRKLVSALQTTEANLKNKAKVLTNLYTDKINGKISEEEYSDISLILQEEKKKLLLRKKNIKDKIKEIKRLESEKTDIEKVIEDYLENYKLTHEIVNETIDYIEIGAKKDGRNRIINIYWKL